MKEMEESELDLLLAGTDSAILMIEVLLFLFFLSVFHFSFYIFLEFSGWSYAHIFISILKHLATDLSS
jgi:hypothetical protein